MRSQELKLAIVYRIYPKISRQPVVFPEDKYKLAKFCLKSFKRSLGSLKVKIWALLDNCPKDYEELFKELFDSQSLEIVPIKEVGAFKTFNLQMNILLNQNFSNFIYFAEDDYYYFPNQIQKMIRFLKDNNDVDFVTPYDRLHDYTFEPNQKYRIKIYANKHWRTANMSFSTFLTTKNTIKETRKIFKIYSDDPFGLGGRGDAIVWLCLSKHGIFNFFKIAKSYFKNRAQFYIYYKAWRCGWKQILFGKKWNLWVPIPTIGTHMQYNHLPPTIDWKRIFKSTNNVLNDNS